MRFEDLVDALKKRLWIIIALTLIAGLAGAVVAQVQEAQYKVEIAVAATAPLDPITQQPNGSIQLGLVSLAPSIANAAESITVAEVVSDRLAAQNIEIPPEELLGKVSAVPEPNSSSVKISFTDSSPTRVSQIANEWGDTLVLLTYNSDVNEIYDPEFSKVVLSGSMVFTNRAVEPESPSQPKPGLYVALGLFVGLLLGLVLVIMIELFNPRFRSPQEVEEIMGLPVLAALPRIKGDKARALLPELEGNPAARDAYSELRSNLVLSVKEASARSILAAQAVPVPGGAVVCANLAISIANTGRNTLLIDCDLEGGEISRLMGLDGRPGLGDALEEGRIPRGGSIVEGGFPYLSILPSGRRSHRSTDLLSLPLFEESLREMEGLFDIVVAFAPPLTTSVDAAVVATVADMCLVTIDTGLATRKSALEAMKNLTHMNVRPAGIVLDDVKVRGRAAAGRKAKPQSVPGVAGRPAPAVSQRAAAPPWDERPAAPAPPEPAPQAKAPSAGAAAHAPSPRGEESPAAAAPGKTAPARAGIPTAPASMAAAAREGASGATPISKTEEELRQIQEIVADDFRRLGEAGAPIPKQWLRGLNSDKADVRESATAAVSAYYHAFLRRYDISGESVDHITATIIRMMRREGEFSEMSEEEGQERLKRMLMEAGAKFSGSRGGGKPPAAGEAAGKTAGPVDAGKGREAVRPEKRRFRLDTRKGRDRESHSAEEEDVVDWE